MTKYITTKEIKLRTAYLYAKKIYIMANIDVKPVFIIAGLAVIASILEGFLLWLISYYLKGEKDLQFLWLTINTMYVLLMAIIIVTVFRVLLQKKSYRYASDCATLIAWRLYRELINGNKSALKEMDIAESSSSIVVRSSNYSRDFIMTSTLILSNSIIGIVYFLALMKLSERLLIFITLVAAINYLVVHLLVSDKVARYGENSSRHSTSVFQALSNTLSNLRFVKVSGISGWLGERFLKAFHLQKRAEADQLLFANSPRYIIEAGILLSIILFVHFDSDLAATSPEVYIPFFVAAQRLAPLVQQIYGSYLSITGNLISAETILKSFSNEVDKKDPNLLTIKQSSIESIQLKSVVVGYSQPLFSISRELRKGDALCIKGGSGSGKSTLIDTLIGLQKPIDGEVLINNIDLNKLNPVDFWQHISYAPQGASLFDGKLIDNVLCGRVLDQDRLDILMRICLVDEFIGKHDFNNKIVNSTLPELSGGQMQRILLMRALYSFGSVVILDEPTSALDSITSLKLIENIKDFCRFRILVLITHSNDVAERFQNNFTLTDS